MSIRPGGRLADFGLLLTLSTFGWPLLSGVIKGVYDILLLIKFQKVRPPEEARAARN